MVEIDTAFGDGAVQLKHERRQSVMSISRRKFLGAAGALGGLAVGAGASASTSQPVVNKDSMGMLTDLRLCVGCRRCEWACNDANTLPNEPLEALDTNKPFDALRDMDQDHFTVVNRFETEGREAPVFVKRQCMHCNDPACASACPVKALTKQPEGPVIYNEKLCIGCRYCMVACPFMVPGYEYDSAFSPRVRKCSMCFSRFTSGEGMPACAGICPQEAITFGRREDLLLLARTRIKENPGEYVDHIYGEHEAGGTSWLYISPVPFEELDFKQVGDRSYPDRTKGYLSLVPLVHTIWPMLLMGLYAFNSNRGSLPADSE